MRYKGGVYYCKDCMRDIEIEKEGLCKHIGRGGSMMDVKGGMDPSASIRRRMDRMVNPPMTAREVIANRQRGWMSETELCNYCLDRLKPPLQNKGGRMSNWFGINKSHEPSLKEEVEALKKRVFELALDHHVCAACGIVGHTADMKIHEQYAYFPFVAYYHNGCFAAKFHKHFCPCGCGKWIDNKKGKK